MPCVILEHLDSNAIVDRVIPVVVKVSLRKQGLSPREGRLRLDFIASCEQ